MWTDESGPVQILMRFRKGEDGWRVIEITLSTLPDFTWHSLDSSVLRRLPFGAMTELSLERIVDAEELRRDPWTHLPERIQDLIRGQLDALRRTHGERPGPRSLPFDHFAELAAVYEASSRAGLTPTEQVALWAGVTRAAAEKQILRARELGFLPAPQVGRQMAWLDEEPQAGTSSADEWFRRARKEMREEKEIWKRAGDE